MDADLASIQNARTLLRRTHAAQAEFARCTQDQVDRVVDAMARAATDHAEELAKLAVEESGLGRVASKILKNRFVSIHLHRAYRNLRTCGVVHEDRARGVVEIATPMGIVAGIIPITNPTSTAIFKILIALKGRNGIVLSPHPFGVRCIQRAAEVCRRAAIAAGAPADLITCMDSPTLEGTQALMKHDLTSVIVATGGPGVVQAAYSSGKPAFGVGPGNPPVFVHHTADLAHAARCIAASQGFDYGTICSSEQSLVVERAVAAAFRAALTAEGAHFCDARETQLLQRAVQTSDGRLNTKIVGKSPQVIATAAGFSVPAETTILIAPERGVGRDFPLSREKLAPILAWYECDEWRSGCDLCIELIRYYGSGHTMGIYSRDPAVIREFALEKPVARVIVNGPTTQGSVGYSTNLSPSMTLGCGTMGGNITTDNIGPQHLINIKRVAYPRPEFFAEMGMTLDRSNLEPGAPAGTPAGPVVIDEGDVGEAKPVAPGAHRRYGGGGAGAGIEQMIERALRGARRPPDRNFYDSDRGDGYDFNRSGRLTRPPE
ncbi:MAG: aldehyde dehydrogenase family protein [Planctomycetota bacterium]